MIWTTFGIQGLWDLKGCALAITYESDVNKVKPEDFTIFSVNHTCVWYKDTNFQVPARMPPCPEGGCICAWFWIHSEKSGGEQSMGISICSSFPANRLLLFSHPIMNRLHERVQVQHYWFGVQRWLGSCETSSSMWCRSREGCYGSHARELHIWCETTLLLVPKREKQCLYSNRSPASRDVIDIVFHSRRCLKAHTLHLFTWTFTTSKMAHRTTFSWIRTLIFRHPARAKRKYPLPSTTRSRRTPPGILPQEW